MENDGVQRAAAGTLSAWVAWGVACLLAVSIAAALLWAAGTEEESLRTQTCAESGFHDTDTALCPCAVTDSGVRIVRVYYSMVDDVSRGQSEEAMRKSLELAEYYSGINPEFSLAAKQLAESASTELQMVSLRQMQAVLDHPEKFTLQKTPRVEVLR